MKEKEKKESEKSNALFVDVGERFKIEKQKRKKCEGEVCCGALRLRTSVQLVSVQFSAGRRQWFFGPPLFY